jgi:hypothetical protein
VIVKTIFWMEQCYWKLINAERCVGENTKHKIFIIKIGSNQILILLSLTKKIIEKRCEKRGNIASFFYYTHCFLSLFKASYLLPIFSLHSRFNPLFEILNSIHKRRGRVKIIQYNQIFKITLSSWICWIYRNRVLGVQDLRSVRNVWHRQFEDKAWYVTRKFFLILHQRVLLFLYVFKVRVKYLLFILKLHKFKTHF